MRSIEWMMYLTINFFMMSKILMRRALIYNSFENIEVLRFIFLENHIIITYMLFSITFLLFVFQMRKGYVRYLFQRLVWTMFACLFGPCFTLLVIFMVYKGLFWLIFPFLCVIWNDIFAYLFGFFYGKTPLIQLSPKKTWEGFAGGVFGTMVWAAAATYFLSDIDLFVCPQEKLTFSIFENLQCESDPIF